MAKTPNTKRRLIELLKLLFDRTDESHGLTLADIASHLEELGISSERKALYDDVATLRGCGIDVVVSRHGGKTTYAIGKRPLSLRDLSLLIDCVQSSPFLTDELSHEVHEDLLSIASMYERTALQGQIEVPGRAHLANEDVFDNLGVVREAIRLRKQITFRYFTYDAEKHRSYHEYRGTGDTRTMTPVRVIFANGLYYVVLWEHWYDKFAYYRLDRMDKVSISEADAVRNVRIANYSVAEDESVEFGLFDAERETISLLLRDPYFVNALIDKFGLDVHTYPKEDGQVKANVKVTLSPAFLGWVFSLHGECVITSPKNAVRKYREYIEAALTSMGDYGASEGTESPEDDDSSDARSCR